MPPTSAPTTSPTRQSYRFSHRLRVRWAEVDMQKIVFFGNYLMYFDTAVADYWRALALPYASGMALLQGDVYAKKVSIEYHASAHYDDVLDVCLTCARVGTSSMLFRGDIFRGDVRLCSVEMVYVFADPATQTSKPVPPALRNMFTAFEAGQPVVAVKSGTWSELGPLAQAVRTEVFVQEQNIPINIEWDEQDATAVHAVALNRLGQPVATGRLLPCALAPSSGLRVAKIGRMAVMRVLRGTGLGADILHALMAIAAQRGDHAISLNAQVSAQGFYARLGFTPQGERFNEAGIAHIEMVKQIAELA